MTDLREECRLWCVRRTSDFLEIFWNGQWCYFSFTKLSAKWRKENNSCYGEVRIVREKNHKKSAVGYKLWKPHFMRINIVYLKQIRDNYLTSYILNFMHTCKHYQNANSFKRNVNSRLMLSLLGSLCSPIRSMQLHADYK